MVVILVRMNDSRGLVGCNLAGTSLGFRFRNSPWFGLLPGCSRRGRRSHGAKMCLVPLVIILGMATSRAALFLRVIIGNPFLRLVNFY